MMSTNQGSSLSFTILLALAVLALAGCGGGESAPAPAPPPAPPPPPPFVPQSVVIDLGSSGEQLTLQTTEAGGFTRNGEAFASGTTVEAAGNTYRLTLASGTWTAAYEAPSPWAVSLGRSGEALLITRREDGLYEGNGMVFESGGIVTAANGNQYTLTFADDRWTRGMQRISNPGRRVYRSYRTMPRILNGYGTLIVSTSSGVITGRKAAQQQVGGELICSVW